VTLDTDFKPPVSQVPIFLINAAIMGAVWGLLRAISGSIIVASLSHGLWNGIAYVFFGFGIRAGALGITNTMMFGPEIGVLGLLVNVVFVVALWQWWKKSNTD
jgi:membrane protease YdiL (CAAX protease family)